MSYPYSENKFGSVLVPYNKTGKVNLEKENDYWIFSNGMLSFKTSPDHGASLFSAKIMGDDNELFFTRYPNKGPFSWFNGFVGGLSPNISIVGTNAPEAFVNNVWSDPELIKENGWYGLQYKLNNPTTSDRLTDFSITMTYYTKPNSPLIWNSLNISNNSGITTAINGSIDIFLHPINQLHYKYQDKIMIGTQTERSQDFTSNPPHNWAIVEMTTQNARFLFSNINPKGRLWGYYMNTSGYSLISSFDILKIKPGETKIHNSFVLFGSSVEELHQIYRYGQPFVNL